MMHNNSSILNIAIDGPAGSGKSTAAKNLAKALGIEYIDTGAMYRAVAYKAMESGAVLDDDTAVGTMLKNTEIDFCNGSIYLDGEDVSGKIRQPEISKAASTVSQLAACRSRLTELQRSIASSKSIVMDGRDIGTNVLPNADYKFYITASAELRAERRLAELGEKGSGLTFEDVLKDINDRDSKDMTRTLNPLKKADDAVEIITDNLGIDETTQRLMEYIDR